MIDLSCNFIGDSGAEMLFRGLSGLRALSSLNISRNHFTDKSVRHFTKYLARHSSKLTYLNVSFNTMGDGAASVACLLMRNVPSRIEVVDLSYCDIRDAGIQDLTVALSQCTTLRCIHLKGNFVSHVSLAPLVAAISARHKRFIVQASRLDSKLPVSNLCVDIGGLAITGNLMRSLSLRAMKSSFPNVDDCSLLITGVLRRRLQFFISGWSEPYVVPAIPTQLESSINSRSKSATVEQAAYLVVRSDERLNVVCLRIQLSSANSTA